MNKRAVFFIAAAIVAGIAVALWWLRPTQVATSPTRTSTPAVTPPALPADSTATTTATDRSTLADGLNAPGGTAQRDLAIVAEILMHWQTNFPRDGNPVGTNAEITATLAGANSLALELIPRDHPAINPRGELCDRWGTPLRFHQWSGTVMEVISAGPDRDFATSDDLSTLEPSAAP